MTIYHSNYPRIAHYKEHELAYLNTSEICQGCPEVGKIRIDGATIKDRLFGGPFLIWNNSVFIPWYNSSNRLRFQPCLINLETTQIKIYPKHFPLVLFKNVNAENVEFFEDLNNTRLISIPIEKFVDAPPVKELKGCARFLPMNRWRFKD